MSTEQNSLPALADPISEIQVSASSDVSVRPINFFVVSLIFFCSGAAALIYEISWSRQIGLLFGHTAHSAAIVLGSYFAGMAIGYLFGARLAARVRPLFGYGIAEFVVAGWASLVPSLLKLAESTTFAEQWIGSSLTWQIAWRALFCFVLLLPATVALGVTLPLMAEFLSPGNRPSTTRVSLAYAFNTAGALVGVLSATVCLLIFVGVEASSYLAAGLSVLCGLAACRLSLSLERPSVTESSEQAAKKTHKQVSLLTYRFWLFVAAMSGFVTVGLEVLYTRLFSLVFHNSTYTFGAVVAVSLAALASGAACAALFLRYSTPEKLTIRAGSLAAFAVALSVYLFARLTQFEYFLYGDSFVSYISGAFGLVMLIVFPPMVLLGMLLPTVWKALETNDVGSGSVVGRMTAANTLAASVGSLAAGFLLLPGLGLWGSFGLQVVIVFTSVLGLLWRQKRRRTFVISGLGFSMLAAATIVVPRHLERSHTNSSEELIRRWDSAYGWIDVVRNRKSGSLKVRQNLHYRFGATGSNSKREYRQAHLPLLLHANPQEALFVGLGTGLTAGAAVPHREVEQITVVELIPEVIEATRLLAEYNFGIVDHPKTDLRTDDAHHYLLRTERRFDVIVADLFVPWESQTGYLYTREHYELTRRRLKPGGLFCQWLPLYQMGAREFELIADSFATVFPQTTLWWGRLDSRRPILALIGSDQPITFHEERLDKRIVELTRSSESRDSYIGEASHLLQLCLGRWSIRSPEDLNTNEHPRVEFLAPLTHRDRATLKGAILRRYFDDVFSGLPAAGMKQRGEPKLPRMNTEQRRNWHRLVLFGET